MSKIHEILNNRVREFEIPYLEASILETVVQKVNDKKYISFLNEVNGGFFYESSLQLYGACLEPDFHNILYVNQILIKEYETLVEGLFFFGQDIFGNQFAFSSKGVVLFNIETAEKEIIANDFEHWVTVLIEDIDFYTGVDFVSNLKEGNAKYYFNKRLCAKIPFIMGGDYVSENLYSQIFPKYLFSNANIAKQVYHLKDGTNINLIIKD